MAAHPNPPSYELSEQIRVQEASSSDKTGQVELYAHEAALEMGRSSLHIAPVDLAGDVVRDEDEKGLHPEHRAQSAL